MQKSQSPLILRFPPVHLYLYQGNNAALDLVLSLVLLISFLGALREKSTRQCLIISCSSSCALGQGRIICLTSAVQGFSVCSVNHLLGICSDKTNTAPGNHSGEGKKKKVTASLALAWKEGVLLSHFWAFFHHTLRACMVTRTGETASEHPLSLAETLWPAGLCCWAWPLWEWLQLLPLGCCQVECSGCTLYF